MRLEIQDPPSISLSNASISLGSFGSLLSGSSIITDIDSSSEIVELLSVDGSGMFQYPSSATTGVNYDPGFSANAQFSRPVALSGKIVDLNQVLIFSLAASCSNHTSKLM